MASVWLKLRAMLAQAKVTILVEDGEPSVVKGTVSKRLLRELRDVLDQHRVQSGVIQASKTAVGPRIEFSRHFPSVTQQRIRNVWFANQVDYLAL